MRIALATISRLAIAVLLGATHLPALAAKAIDAADAACFASGAAYAASIYGADFAGDDNIAVGTRQYGGQLFTVVEDKTSGTNHPRTLMLARAGKGYCVVLSTPAVAQLEPSMPDARGMPLRFTAIDQAPPGLPAHQIIYSWQPAGMRYAARECALISDVGAGKHAKAKPVPCEDIASAP